MSIARSGFVAILLLAGLLGWRPGLAHPDLDLQIEQLTEEIAERAADAGLYLRRGDLYRRHADWARARRDFATARRLEPAHPLLDWYEGRALAEQGEWAAGVRLLTRFLCSQPEHAAAYRARAVAHWRLGDPRVAAADFESAIANSVRPAPGLYRSLVVTLVHGGEPRSGDALDAVDRGLGRFPAEVSLLGLGVDIALASGSPGRAAAYLDRVAPRLASLPQWAYRAALHSCLSGDAATAAEQFRLLGTRPARAGTWAVPERTVANLAAGPEIAACRRAAQALLLDLQP